MATHQSITDGGPRFTFVPKPELVAWVAAQLTKVPYYRGWSPSYYRMLMAEKPAMLLDHRSGRKPSEAQFLKLVSEMKLRMEGAASVAAPEATNGPKLKLVPVDDIRARMAVLEQAGARSRTALGLVMDIQRGLALLIERDAVDTLQTLHAIMGEAVRETQPKS